jgi:hypothetical protein
MRRVAKTKKIGHLGTLDPIATGVLPLVVGRATRLAQFYTRSDKIYEGVVRFGWSTTTTTARGDQRTLRRRSPRRRSDIWRFRGDWQDSAGLGKEGRRAAGIRVARWRSRWSWRRSGSRCSRSRSWTAGGALPRTARRDVHGSTARSGQALGARTADCGGGDAVRSGTRERLRSSALAAEDRLGRAGADVRAVATADGPSTIPSRRSGTGGISRHRRSGWSRRHGA